MLCSKLREITIAQVRVPDKTNETTQVKALARSGPRTYATVNTCSAHAGRRALQQGDSEIHRREAGMGLPHNRADRQQANPLQGSKR